MNMVPHDIIGQTSNKAVILNLFYLVYPCFSRLWKSFKS